MKLLFKIVTIGFLFTSINVYGTRQSYDTIYIEGNLFLLYSSLHYNNPVLEYFLINKIKQQFGNYFATNCYRGHNATYSISNDSVFINKVSQIRFRYESNDTARKFTNIRSYQIHYGLDTLFKKQPSINKVFADWHSGFLRIESPHLDGHYRGGCLRDSTVYQMSLPAEYILCKVEKGKVVRMVKYDRITFEQLSYHCAANTQKQENVFFNEYEGWENKKSRKTKYWIK